MTPKQLKDNALISESIAHWKRMRDDSDCKEIPTSRWCALCKEYLEPEDASERNCFDCPVSLKTGHAYCDSTPYQDAHHEWIDKKHHRDTWLLAATKEIEFLESLITPIEPPISLTEKPATLKLNG